MNVEHENLDPEPVDSLIRGLMFQKDNRVRRPKMLWYEGKIGMEEFR